MRATGFAAQLGVLLAVTVVTTAAAGLAGAADLGIALGFGQIAFVLALVYLLLRR